MTEQKLSQLIPTGLDMWRETRKGRERYIEYLCDTCNKVVYRRHCEWRKNSAHGCTRRAKGTPSANFRERPVVSPSPNNCLTWRGDRFWAPYYGLNREHGTFDCECGREVAYPLGAYRKGSYVSCGQCGLAKAKIGAAYSRHAAELRARGDRHPASPPREMVVGGWQAPASDLFDYGTALDVKGEPEPVNLRDLNLTRAECPDVRPCPYVSCKYHLFSLAYDPRRRGYLDSVEAVDFRTLYPGENKLQRNRITDDEALRLLSRLKTSCVLDVADAGGAALEAIGESTGVTREAVRQLETEALRSTERAARTAGLTLAAFEV